jgi:hypothetical protein
MKTLSGTFAFVVLAVIAIVTLPSCCKKVSKEVLADHEFCKEYKFCLKFGTKKENKENEEDYEYVDVNQPDFDNALCALTANGDKKKPPFEVRYKPDAGSTPIPVYTPCPPVNIKTTKITTSGVARTEPAEESSAYDPNAVHRVRSNSLQEIKDVLAAFTTPTPTP